MSGVSAIVMLTIAAASGLAAGFIALLLGFNETIGAVLAGGFFVAAFDCLERR